MGGEKWLNKLVERLNSAFEKKNNWRLFKSLLTFYKRCKMVYSALWMIRLSKRS